MSHRALVLVAAALLTAAATAAEDWLIDITEQAGLDFVHFNGRSGRLYYPEVVGAGGALFDYDGDGDLDLYTVQGAMLGPDRTVADSPQPWPKGEALRDRLWRNDANAFGPARFVDVTEQSGIEAPAYGMGAATGDIDNDGDVDLYVTNFGANQLWLNDGDGTFTDVSAASGTADERWSVSASFFDYDRDGWLDLWVVNYLDYSYRAHKTCLSERGEVDYCLPNAYRPVADRLYRNRGDGTFEDRSQAAGISTAPANGLGIATGDFNDDRRIDVYVANDLMANQLWLQQEDGTFRDDALISGAALNREGKAEASMGVGAGDFDDDGDIDLFMTHFHRETNTLYRNQGNGFFEDATQQAELGAPSFMATSFGTGFADFDNDGDLDLIAVNGAVVFGPGVDRKQNDFPLDEPNQLFRNDGDGRFVDITSEAGEALQASRISRGALLGDLDNDGDVDVVVTNNAGPARVLDNRRGHHNDWVGLRLLTGSPGRSALGALVWLIDGEGNDTFPALRRAQSEGGYASANDPRLLLGLGQRTGGEPVRVKVEWPDGSTETFGPVARGRYHDLRQGHGRAVGGG